jgi:hypothetical protein
VIVKLLVSIRLPRHLNCVRTKHTTPVFELMSKPRAELNPCIDHFFFKL